MCYMISGRVQQQILQILNVNEITATYYRFGKQTVNCCLLIAVGYVIGELNP